MRDDLRHYLEAAKSSLEGTDDVRQLRLYGRLVRVTGVTLGVVGWRPGMGERCLVAAPGG